MEVVEHATGTAIVLELVGRLDGTTSPALQQRLNGVLARGPSLIVLDLANLIFVSSAGLRIFLMAAKQAKAQGAGIILCGLRENVQTVFDISGLMDLFAIRSDREAALATAG
jgi:anti-anti-sigma factor